jgi:prolipoprotein diacylglyceryltransferase
MMQRRLTGMMYLAGALLGGWLLQYTIRHPLESNLLSTAAIVAYAILSAFCAFRLLRVLWFNQS